MLPELIVKPDNLKKLWKTLPSLPASRAYLAGGTDLVIRANAGIENSRCWVDISDISELKAVEEKAGKIFLGSAVKISELENYSFLAKYAPTLISAVDFFASPSIRNMATLGGNLANSSPCADAVCALMSEGAEVILLNRGEKRKVPLSKFFRGYRKTVLKKDELICGFEIKKSPREGVYLKLLGRGAFGISKIALAISVSFKDKTLNDCRIAAASAAPTTVRAFKTEKFLKGKKLNSKIIEDAAKIIVEEVKPISDVRSIEEYRKAMSGVLLKRAFVKIL